MLLAVRKAGGIKATASGNFVRKFVETMVDPLLQQNIGYRFRYGIDVSWIQHEIRFLLYPLYRKARQWIEVEVLPNEILHPLTLQRLLKELPPSPMPRRTPSS